MADQVEPMQGGPDHDPNGPTFTFRRGEVMARGQKVSNGFLVFAGSHGPVKESPSFEASPYKEERDRLIEEGIMEIDADRVVLTRNHLFSSPTAGAAVVGGYPTNKLPRWKGEDGKTLRDYMNNPASRPRDSAAHDRPLAPTELEFRRRWYEAHVARFVADEDHYRGAKDATDGFKASANEALRLLADLRRTGDLDRFIKDIRRWAVAPETLDFNGFAGQLLLNQLYDRTDEPQRFAHLLADSLTVPASEQQAAEKLTSMVDYVKSIKVGAYPAPGSVPFLLSYFWALADWDRWPVMWASAVRFIEFSTGESLPDDPPEKYRVFAERVRELTSDHVQFETTAAWWRSQGPVFLDEVLADRAAFGLDAEASVEGAREINARALVGIAHYWGKQLAEDVEEALGHSIKVNLPKANSARPDLWVDWRINEAAENGLSMRVWVNDRGAAVALRPGVNPQGWMDKVAPKLTSAKHDGCRVFGGSSSIVGKDVGLRGSHWAEFVYGRWFDREEFENVDLAETVVETSRQLTPLFNELLSLAKGTPKEPPEGGDESLRPLVEEWLAATDYPNQWHKDAVSQRERFAELLAPERISIDDWQEIRRIWTTKEAGGAGAMGTLKTALKDADESAIRRFLEIVRYLCWGTDPDVERIRRVLEDDEMRFTGLGESLVMKFLWISHPERYGNTYKYWDDNGKQAILHSLKIEEPSGSRAERQYESARILNELTEPFLPGDTLAQSEFLWWVCRRPDEPEPGALENGEPDPEDEADPIEELAAELLVERGFLDDAVALLEDKGQVIFYGPPGTGKTYLARKLADVLTADPSRRALVQFHPSSSYEDFFEGYRPEAAGDDMTYQLTLGPLALMAERAEDSPDLQHVMIIDEINRANLPKVLGELLFLLEYRDESIQTLYRAEEEFSLPGNLWFIGTMNTADRSIALVDAALRRRFHFIPFFPNREPIAGLLDRWLEANDEPAWVGELVAQVNDELKDALGGDDLLVGPSNFM
ncbi:MAG: DUF4357 domain-containing protein, partial [Acidimicrobiia bacterium]|nr:DUF4357 domain-containing protein [Acidimicrobiia bacterium]